MKKFEQKQNREIPPEESPQTQGGETFHNIEIEDLFEPMGELITRMRRRIQDGQYRLVIGDDASGRVPAYIFNRFLKALYEKHELPAPKTLFMAGSRSLVGEEAAAKSAQIEHVLHERHGKDIAEIKKTGGVVLLVTDTIVSGKSLQPLADALSRLGVTFEIASIAGAKDEKDALQQKLGGRIFFGGEGATGIYDPNEHGIHGTWKDPKALFALSLRHETLKPLNRKEGEKRKEVLEEDAQKVEKGAAEIQQKIIGAREDAEKVAQKLVDRYGRYM